MGSKLLASLLLALIGCCALLTVQAKERKVVGWAYVSSQAVDVRTAPSDRRRTILHLGRGTLVEVDESVSRGGDSWSRVRALNLETLEPQVGWINSSQVEIVPLDRFPADADLLKLLGGAYLEDFVNSHIKMARFLVRQSGAEAALVCLLGSSSLPQTRLQVFRRLQGKVAPEAFLEFPFSEMKPAVTAVEVRDLLGDGNECLVTHERFDFGPQTGGVNLVIRRIGHSRFEKLWEAPLEYRNLASFPPHYRVLEPPEKNIGAAGTVARGTVNFHPRGNSSQPVWKGKVEFHVAGREEPVESVPIEKVCAWDGTKFQALR
jgi:hypothetical protein